MYNNPKISLLPSSSHLQISNNFSNFEFQKKFQKKKKGGANPNPNFESFSWFPPSILKKRKNQELKSGNRGDQRSHLRRQGSVYAASEKKKKKEKGKSLKIMGEGKKRAHAWSWRGESRETGSRNGTKCETRNGNEYEIPYAINGYRNGRRKKFHIPERGCGASGFMNEISFPEKTPPIRGLREADRFILGRIQADQFVRCFARELESPIVTDRLNGLSLSFATNLENRIFHRPHRIVFATFENDMDYDFDSDSMGIVFFPPSRRFSFGRCSVFGKG